MTEIKQDDPDTKLDRTFNTLRQHASQALVLDLEFYSTLARRHPILIG